MIGETLPNKALETQRECPDCGLLQVLPSLPPNAEANCLRCDGTLRRTRTQWSTRALTLTLTSLILYMIAVLAPFLSVDIVGMQRQTTMISLPASFTSHGAWELAIIVTVTAIVAPLAKILVMLFVLVGLRTAEPPKILPIVFKWYHRIGPWAMVEVFLLGVFVAFTRLGAIATVQTGVALYAVGALMISMVTADYLLDSQGVWEEMEARGLVPANQPGRGTPISCHVCSRVNHADEGDRCSRCAAVLHLRLPNSITNTWALLIASAALYIPANVFPVLTTIRLGRATPSTILGGAQELLDAGMWPLALLVFVASIMVPLLKLLSLTFMLIMTHRRSTWRLHDRTRLFRLVDFIGRWSMIDVFMLSTLVGLVQAGVIASIEPGTGAICFGSVVVLTMVAAACFDPRLMWDAAGAGALDHLFPHESAHSTDRPAGAPATAGTA
jgi:paraquat-inducible protein A